jgi:putative FmdB family regulatory protein
MPTYEYECPSCGLFELRQSFDSDTETDCPSCGTRCGRIFSKCNVIVGGKQANQYNDCKGARFWRDRDGNRHRITSSDGSSKSPTVTSKRERSDEQVEAIKKRAAKRAKNKRMTDSYRRYEKSAMKTAKRN